MLFSPRITHKQLAALARRLAISLDAGVDVRKVLEREATLRSSGALQRELAHVREEVLAGQPLATAVATTGNYFPPLFRELLAVGEETGHLSEVLRRLAEHYEHQVRLRRQFLAGITWPAIQLAAAVGIVGAVIWITGLIGSMNSGPGSRPIDILGFGLMGNRGLLIYLTIVGLVAGAAWMIYQSARRGSAWTRPLIRVLSQFPVLGPALETLTLSRLAWSLHLTLDSDMDIRRSLPLALENCGSPRLAGIVPGVLEELSTGAEIHEALAIHAELPGDFRDALEIGERSGQLPESLGRLSKQYEEQARHALLTINVVAGFAVWAMVAGVIILMIFRIFGFYLGVLDDALKNT